MNKPIPYKAKVRNKATTTLKLDYKQFNIVKKNLISLKSKLWKMNKPYSGDGARWYIFLVEIAEGIYKTYGVSGDYSFGNSPDCYAKRLSGNEKAGKEVLDQFVSEYF